MGGCRQNVVCFDFQLNTTHIIHEGYLIAYLFFFFFSHVMCVAKSKKQTSRKEHRSLFSAAYVHLMLLPLCKPIWSPVPPVTAGRRVQGQAIGEKGSREQ